MSNLIKWHLRFIDMAKLVASWSKDRSTKVGAIAVGPHREVCSVGYNGFPRGLDDCLDSRHQRPDKYAWTEHAERNLIYNATRVGVCLEGCTLYCTHFPCPDCARGIIQSGISSLYYPIDDTQDGKEFRERAHKTQLLALEMLREAGVSCKVVKPWTDPKSEDAPDFFAMEVKAEDLMP